MRDMKKSLAFALGVMVLAGNASVACVADALAADALKESEASSSASSAPGATKAVVITAKEKKTAKKQVKEQAAEENLVGDPAEGFNRGIYGFNDALDTAVVAPVSRGYRAAVPAYARNRVSSALGNLGEPVNFLNAALQGDVENVFTCFWRFVINTTVGIGGLYDVAGEAGLKPVKEDFGQTLGAWGVDNGAYIMLPVLGPSTARDTVGLVVDTLTNPFTYLTTPVVVTIKVTEGIDKREGLLDLTDEIQRTSFDPYSTIKSTYIQHRKSQVDNYE